MSHPIAPSIDHPAEFVCLDHLNESAQRLFNKSIDAKIIAVFEDKFILHPQAQKILSILKRTLAKPESERPAGHMIIGPSSSGKTGIINKLYRDLGGDPANRVGASERMPILVVEMPPRATEPRVMLAMARALRLPVLTENESRKVTDIILRKLKERHVRMVVFLEFDHIGPIGAMERAVVFHLIKNITNEGISIVGAGTQKCVELILEDEQITSRLRPLYLHGFPKDQTFVNFVATLETFYPFPEPSYISRDHLDYVFQRTQGVAGEVVALLNEAAAWALRNGRNVIDQEALTDCDFIEGLSHSRCGKT